MITLGRLHCDRVQAEIADAAGHDQANVTVAQIILPDRFEQRLVHFLRATSESRDRSSGPNPRAAPCAPPAGRRGHCKSECLQKCRRHKAGRDRRPKPWRRPDRRIRRRYKSEVISAGGFSPRRFRDGIGFHRGRRDGGGFSVFGKHEKTSGVSKGNSSGETDERFRRSNTRTQRPGSRCATHVREIMC